MIKNFLKRKITTSLQSAGYTLQNLNDPARNFQNHKYLRHNARRLEHLASLHIPVSGKSILEVGAGIGDHTHYYLDRNCEITITEARQENLDALKRRYPKKQIEFLDMDNPAPLTKQNLFDVIHCYGLLYHLSKPEIALEYLSEHCGEVMLLESCVSFGEGEHLNMVEEPIDHKTQAFAGQGCRPTRQWIYSRLKKLFEHVYIPKTQPNHEEFPIDWTYPQSHSNKLSRAVFVASRREIQNDKLSTELLDRQSRHP